MRVLFWGTPTFAIPTLRALLGEGFDVVAVVTRPDRPAGRGRRMSPSPVKAMAEDEALTVLQPDKPGDPEFLDVVRALQPDVGVVAAYGRFLPAEALDLPVHGTINVHPSLLPALRGAAPIPWALIQRLERTGVSVIRLVEEMDAGPILRQVEEPILPEESATELAIRLAEVGADVLVEALLLLEGDSLEEREQDHEAATFAPPISADDARVDWTREPADTAAWMRGMDSTPGAWTTWRGDRLKLYRPLVEASDGVDASPGTVLAVDGGLRVASGAGAVRIREVQPAGRRRMEAEDWLRGAELEPGEVLGG